MILPSELEWFAKHWLGLDVNDLTPDTMIQVTCGPVSLKVGDRVYHPSSGSTGTIEREVGSDLFEVAESVGQPGVIHVRRFIAHSGALVAANSGTQVTFDDWNKKINESHPASQGKSQAETWKAEGRCPQCGELGHFSHLALVCSVHGPY